MVNPLSRSRSSDQESCLAHSSVSPPGTCWFTTPECAGAGSPPWACSSSRDPWSDRLRPWHSYVLRLFCLPFPRWSWSQWPRTGHWDAYRDRPTNSLSCIAHSVWCSSRPWGLRIAVLRRLTRFLFSSNCCFESVWATSFRGWAHR